MSSAPRFSATDVANKTKETVDKAEVAIKKAEDSVASKLPFFLKGWSPEFLEFLKYIVFLIMFTTVVFLPRNSDPYFMQLGIDNRLGYSFGDNQEFSFREIKNKGEVVDWITNIFVPTLWQSEDINGDPLIGEEKNFLNTVNRKIGTVRIRSQYVADDSCIIPTIFESEIIGGCYGKISESTISKKDFEYLLYPETDNQTVGVLPFEVIDDGPWFSYYTKISYPSSGNILHLSQEKEIAVSNITNLLLSDWVTGEGVRAMFFDFNVYNPSVDLIGVGKYVFEFLPSGSLVVSGNVR